MGYIKNIRKKIGHETIIMPCACVIIGFGNPDVIIKASNIFTSFKSSSFVAGLALHVARTILSL